MAMRVAWSEDEQQRVTVVPGYVYSGWMVGRDPLWARPIGDRAAATITASGVALIGVVPGTSTGCWTLDGCPN
jgi:hypothetical protein